MADYQNLKFDVEDRIATVSVNRPDKLNALNDQTIRDLGGGGGVLRATTWAA
jgi:enoyl-CoA hydratase